MSDDCNHEMIDLELYERLFRDKNKKKRIWERQNMLTYKRRRKGKKELRVSTSAVVVPVNVFFLLLPNRIGIKKKENRTGLSELRWSFYY